MEISSRHRPLALLTLVVAAQVLLIAFQVRHSDRGQRDVPLVRYWAAAIVTPIERAGTWAFSKVGGVWTGYVALHSTRQENLRLRDENDQLKLRNRELETEVGEAQRLSALLNFRQAHPEAPMIAAQVLGSSTAMISAQVIGASADPNSHTMFINRGDRDHIRRNMGVITPDGIVGKIVEVFPNTAQVQLIDDKESGVGALFADTRTHGVVKGPDLRTGDPRPRMDYIVNDEKVQAGEQIVTSGEDRIFPKGLPVGTVADAKQATPFQTIHVQPAARLDRLEDVLVLLTMQELNLKRPEESSGAPATSPAKTASNPPAAQNPAPPTAKTTGPQP
jgi:rod shape-determining protein MreC